MYIQALPVHCSVPSNSNHKYKNSLSRSQNVSQHETKNSAATICRTIQRMRKEPQVYEVSERNAHDRISPARPRPAHGAASAPTRPALLQASSLPHVAAAQLGVSTSPSALSHRRLALSDGRQTPSPCLAVALTGGSARLPIAADVGGPAAAASSATRPQVPASTANMEPTAAVPAATLLCRPDQIRRCLRRGAAATCQHGTSFEPASWLPTQARPRHA